MYSSDSFLEVVEEHFDAWKGKIIHQAEGSWQKWQMQIGVSKNVLEEKQVTKHPSEDYMAKKKAWKGKVRDALENLLRDYLGIFPKWRTPPPFLGTPY